MITAGRTVSRLEGWERFEKSECFPASRRGGADARWWLTMLVEILDEVDDAI
jgi:hypothetical protein